MPINANVLRLVAAGVFLLILGGMGDAAVERNSAYGLWLTHDRDGVIEITTCGAHLCAQLYAVLDPSIPKTARDVRNAKPGLRARPICGLPIMGNLERQGPATWGNGWVYNPKVGKTYDVEINVRGPRTLVVHGYIGIKLLGRTVVWVRAGHSVTRCKGPSRS